MSPRTGTLSPTDGTMWRRLLARVHPDAGGDHELFIWTRAVQESVAGSGMVRVAEGGSGHAGGPRRWASRGGFAGDRVYLGDSYDFEAATNAARTLAASLPAPFAGMLSLLVDCEPGHDETAIRQQNRGASYKSLAALGHRLGLDGGGRQRLYEIAQEIPLSQRHVGHMFARSEGAA